MNRWSGSALQPTLPFFVLTTLTSPNRLHYLPTDHSFFTNTYQTHPRFLYGVPAAQRRIRRKTEFLLHTWQSEEFTCTCADLLCLL